MMTYILEHYIYTAPFFIGSFIVLGLWPIYCRQRARYLDIHEPFPDGSKHQLAKLNRVWIGGVVLVLSFGYILMSAQRAENHTVHLANNVTRCWHEQYKAAKAQIDLNADNDKISRAQQALQRKFDIATSDWIKDLVVPPGDLVNQPTDSPARRDYGLKRTGEYQDTLNVLGAQSDDLVNQRKALDDERAKHPLPEPTCGK